MLQYDLFVCYDLKMNKIIFVFIVSLLCLRGYTQNPADDNKLYYAVEEQAVPVGGLKQYYENFAAEYKTPELPAGVNEVRLVVSFVVERDGSLADIKVIRDGGFEQAGLEALRVLQKMPHWKPARQNDREVRSQFTLPVTLQVSKKKKRFSDYMNQ